MSNDPEEGAKPNERLLFGARTDNEELVLEVFEDPDSFDINYQDGLGNTALHYAAQCASTSVLEHLLTYDGCDVDFQNRLEGNTPLHAAVKYIEDPEERNYVVESLLDAGADTKIKDKNGDVIYDIITSSNKELDDALKAAIRRAEAEASIAPGDIANDDEDDDDDEGSGSDSE
ncbi:hypothetical protein M422DRAFT_221764 [Sphaerobolus stellatus SS14]|nr:hypothetical protein M422DRAFT_221764 [Sphaerobolus stellatus SS14]